MSTPDARPRLRRLTLADAPEAWSRLGFQVCHARVELGGIELVLGAGGRGIVSWGIAGLDGVEEIDGLPVERADGPAPDPGEEPQHPNGAVGIDHVVLLTPAFDRTAAALERAGLGLRRVTDEIRPGLRQGFRRLGPAILELVQAPPEVDRVHLWGLTLIVRDIHALAGRLASDLGEVRAAVQPGRRIATLRRSAGLSTPLAFMDPPPE
jgi:hypothetical protein